LRILFALKAIDSEPMGIAFLSAMLKEAGHDVRLVVATEEDPVAVARSYQPHLVGYTVYTGTQKYYLELNRAIKEAVPQVFSMFGGPHPTFFPELVQEEGVDGVCIGEGEYAVVDLAGALAGKRTLTDIPNWWIKQDGQVFHNVLRPLINDLDTVPLPDRQSLYDAHPPSRESPIKPFLAGRGCPYNCSFCFNHAYGQLYREKGKRVRRRSVDNLLTEMQQVQEAHPYRFVIFTDDTFSMLPRWLEEFANKYPQAVGVPFWCQVRANLVDDSMAEVLRRAGCVSVSLGVEAGNDELRNRVLRRNMSKEEIIAACDTLRRHGIRFMTNNMVGLPTGTLATDWETLEFNVRLRPAYTNVFLYQPYPKTELGEFALAEGYMLGDFDSVSDSVSDVSVLRFPPGEKRQIENLQKLMGVTVEFPFLRPLVRQLVKLPPNPVFWFIYKLWKGYALKQRIQPLHLSLGEWVHTVWQFMRVRSQ